MPFERKILHQNTVCEGQLSCNQLHYLNKVYSGITKTSVKQRYNQLSSFHEKDPHLSKKFWR